MSLTGVCPACGAAAPLEAFLADAAARKALAAAIALPGELAADLVRYLGLHAPPGRRMAWPKLARVIGDLDALLRAGEVTRNRDTRPARLEDWAYGIAQILAMREAGKLTLPLQGHGLLCELVHRQAVKAGSASAAATGPLHPSHRPATPDSAARSAAGAAHVGALLRQLVPGGSGFSPTPSGVPVGLKPDPQDGEAS